MRTENRNVSDPNGTANANDLPASNRRTNRTFYERLTSNPANGLAFALGVGALSLAAVEFATGQQSQPLARWRWLFQLAHDWMGTDGPNVLLVLVGAFLICWALVSSNKRGDDN